MQRPRIAPRPFYVTESSRRALTTHWHSMLGDGAESSQRAGGGSRTHTGLRPKRCERSASWHRTIGWDMGTSVIGLLRDVREEARALFKAGLPCVPAPE